MAHLFAAAGARTCCHTNMVSCLAFQQSSRQCLQSRHWRMPRAMQLKASAKAQLSPARFAGRTPAAKAALFTGTYATIAGLALAVAPASTFGLLFDAAPVPSAWIRVGGILFATIGLQYLYAGYNDSKLPASSAAPVGACAPGSATWYNARAAASIMYARSFYQGTVWSRLFLVVGFTALVVLRQSLPALLLLAVLNAAGALSMAVAVHKTDRLWASAGVQVTGVQDAASQQAALWVS